MRQINTKRPEPDENIQIMRQSLQKLRADQMAIQCRGIDHLVWTREKQDTL